MDVGRRVKRVVQATTIRKDAEGVMVLERGLKHSLSPRETEYESDPDLCRYKRR